MPTSPLPALTVVGNLKEVLGDVQAGQLVETAMYRATVRFTPNLGGDRLVTWQGELKRILPVLASVDANGNVVSGDGGPVLLLAQDDGLNVRGLQWQVSVYLPPQVLPSAPTGYLKSFWFDATAAGTTVNLKNVVPAFSAPVSGVPGGGSEATSVDDLIDATATGKNVMRASGAADARAAIGAVSAQDDRLFDARKALAATSAGRDAHVLPDLVLNMFGKVAVPSKYDTGQDLSFVGTGTPAVSNDKLTTTNTGWRTLYTRFTAPANVHGGGIRFTLKAPTSGRTQGGLVCFAIGNKLITSGGQPANMDLALHLWTTAETWMISAWDGSDHGGGGQVALLTGNYPIPLTIDGVTEYEIQAWIVGNEVTVKLPDGTKRSVPNSRLVDYLGPYGFFQLMHDDTQDKAEIVSAWATVPAVSPGRGGALTAEGGIVEGFAAFMQPVNFGQGFQQSTGAGDKKIMTSDQFGLSSWKSPAELGLSGGASTVRRGSIMTLGDSLSALCAPYVPTLDACNHQHTGTDWLYWGNVMLGSPFNVLGAAATAGLTLQQIVDQHLPTVLSVKPEVCVFYSGLGNEIRGTGEFPSSLMRAAESQVFDKLDAAGIKVVLGTLVPVVNSSNTGASHSEVERYNAWVTKTAERRGYPVIDFYRALVNPATGTYKSGLTTDNTHPNAAGIAAVVPFVSNALRHFGTPSSARFSLSAYDPTSAIVNKVPNSLLAFSGDTPTAWTKFSPNNGTSTVAAAPNGRPGNRLVLTHGAAGGIYQYAPALAVAPGDEYEFGCLLDASGGGFYVGLNQQDNNTPVACLGSALEKFPLVVPDGTLTYFRGRVPSGVTQLKPFIGTIADAGSTVGVSQWTMRNLTTLATLGT